MHRFTFGLFLFLASLGPFGLLLLGVLDSSFLFMPLGNDLLLVGLTTRHPHLLYLYIPMAAIGSTLGVLLLDVTVRKGGEEGLKKRVSARRLAYLKKKVAQRAGVAVAVATLAPPPFPFTPVMAAASAFGYPRWKLLAVVMAGRIVRFTIIGLLAIWLGRHILTLAKSPTFEWSMGAFIALCTVGSGVSIYNWIHGSRRR